MSVRPNHRAAAVVVAVVALSTAGQLAQASAADLPTRSVGVSTSYVQAQPVAAQPVALAPTNLSVLHEGSTALVSFVDQTAGVGEHVVSYGIDDDVQMLTLQPGTEWAELTDLERKSDYVLAVQSVVDGNASKVSTARFSTS